MFSLDHIVSLLNTRYFGFRVEPNIQPVIWKKAIISLLLISRSSDGNFISTLQDIRSRRPTEIATLNLGIAGMASTEDLVIQTNLLGRLILLKSQL